MSDVSLFKRLLTVEDVAERYCTSRKSIHDRTRTAAIPHIRRRGFRRVLFDPEQLDRWDLGAQLEVVEPGDGSRIVLPRKPNSVEDAYRKPKGVLHGRSCASQ